MPRDTDAFILVFTTPVKHTKSTPSRAGAPACGAVVPSEHQWVTQRPRVSVPAAPKRYPDVPCVGHECRQC